MAPSRNSLLRTFAVLSLITLAAITGAQVVVQWILLRDDLLERERVHGANAIRIEAYAAIERDDFTHWRTPEAQERFERFFRRALLSPDVLGVKIYDAEHRVIWSDEPRLVGQRVPDNERLTAALSGHTLAHLERTLELYVPLSMSPGTSPGTARIAGVVEVYKDPSRALATLSRGRQIILLTSLAGALVLYGALFWIVRGASLRLRTQQDDLTAMQGQLRVSERLAAIGEVSAAVAHGIRNPLANIRASAQVALDADMPAETARRLATITSEVDRLDRWLRALLDVVRPFTPRLGPVEVNALVNDCVDVLAERVAERGVAVERALTSDLPLVTADEVQLQQAVLSVLENALDAAAGRVQVRTTRDTLDGADAVAITIVDDGPGIPPDHLARIFEPFFTTKTRGTGLGLAITRKVVEGHGGRVTLASGAGAGTTVTITLPETAKDVAA